MKRKHEPTQLRNPHQLTIGQHIHSRWCIDRFADGNGRVAVLRKGQQAPFLTKPGNKIFCAKRAWGENLEQGLFSKKELAFYDAVEAIITNGSVINHRAVTEYVLIWQIRAQLAERPPQDVTLNGIAGSPLTKDEEETLEKKGHAFARPGGIVPGRFNAFVDALRKFDMMIMDLEDVRWGVLRAKACAGFLCPDHPANELYVPIAPSIALVARQKDQEVGDVTVNDLNQSSAKQASRLIFGHPDDMAAFVAHSLRGVAG